MYKVIICEGTDGSGKSTLAQTLAVDYGYHYAWFGKPEIGKVFKTYLTRYMDLMKYKFIVLDRAHFSEDVYGPLFRGESELNEQEREILMYILGPSVVTVLCTLPSEVLKVNLQEVPDDLHHDKDPALIATKYREVLMGVAKETDMHLTPYDYRFETAQELMDRLAIDAYDSVSCSKGHCNCS